ncbi:MAG: high-affinity branched-chain amino acid ABC transporter permease LivM [Pseudomonadota bacterium]
MRREETQRASEPGGRSIASALRSAAWTALVVLGLAFPIVAFLTEQDLSNRLVLEPRFTLVAMLVVTAFGARLAIDLLGPHLGTLGAGLQRRLPAASGAGIWVRRTALVGVLAYPILAYLLAGPGGAIKWIDNFGIQILIYVMLGWGLNVVVGLAGLLDLGYVAFYAVGAYSSALLAKELGLSFWLCLPLAGVFAALWGILLGFPVLRLRGDYLAIVTLAFGEIIRLVLINWVDFTGGYAGISGIPRPTFLGIPFNASEEGFAATFGLAFSPLHRLVFLFYLILALALATNWVTNRLRRLPIGRAWEALREDEIACRSLGLDTVATKLTAFAIGAMFGGFGGAFFAARQGFISPESFVFMESAMILAIVVLGGMGSQMGVAIAAVAMVGGTEILRELDWLKDIFGPAFEPTHYRMLLFGLAMVLMMIWRPRGLVAVREPSIVLHETKAISGALVKEGHG